MLRSEQTDQELVASCLKGETEAWDALIRRYQGFIYGLGLRQGLSAADADDLFQEVCLKLYRHLSELRDTRRLSSWIASIVRQQVWTRGRKRGTLLIGDLSPAELERVESGGADGPASDPEAALLEAEREHLVRVAMESLGDDCRRLLTLLYGPEPASYADTAERLGMPTGSVGPRRARCLAALKKKLEKFGF